MVQVLRFSAEVTVETPVTPGKHAASCQRVCTRDAVREGPPPPPTASSCDQRQLRPEEAGEPRRSGGSSLPAPVLGDSGPAV